MSFPLRDSDETPVPDPVGRRFPTVTGTALSGESVCFPDDLFGAPWCCWSPTSAWPRSTCRAGLSFAVREPGLTVYEVPTIPAIAYRPWAGWIDNGMRKGVPRVLWPQVVTLYGEGVPVHEFLGDDGFVALRSCCSTPTAWCAGSTAAASRPTKAATCSTSCARST